MAGKLIFGISTPGVSPGGGGTGAYASKWASLYDAIVTAVFIDSDVVGSIRGAVYRGDATVPTDLICSVPLTSLSAGAFTGADVTPFRVALNEILWIDHAVSAVGACTYSAAAAGTVRSVLNPFATYNPADPYVASGSISIKIHSYAYGYTPPVLTSVNDGNPIQHGQTLIPVVGTDFIDSAGNPAVWLCSTNDFATAPVKVSQVVTGALDTAATINVNAEGLTPGTVYAFVVSALGQVSAPLEVTLLAPPEPPVVQPWLWAPDGVVINGGCIGDGLWL